MLHPRLAFSPAKHAVKGKTVPGPPRHSGHDLTDSDRAGGTVFASRDSLVGLLGKLSLLTNVCQSLCCCRGCSFSRWVFKSHCVCHPSQNSGSECGSEETCILLEAGQCAVCVLLIVGWFKWQILARLLTKLKKRGRFLASLGSTLAFCAIGFKLILY